MAQVSDYPTLVQAIIAYLARADDPDFIAQIDTFIGFAEDTFGPTLLNRQMEATASLTSSSDGTGSVALPADYYRMRALTGLNNGSNIDIPPIGPRAAANLYPDGVTDFVVYHRIMNGTLYVVPAQVQTMTLDYYAKLVGLSSANTTNWLIKLQPTLYMAACMEQAAIWLTDWTNAASFGARATMILGQLTDNLSLDMYNNAEVVLDMVTP